MDYNIFYISANRNECLLQTLLRVAQKSKLLILAVNEMSITVQQLTFLAHPVWRFRNLLTDVVNKGFRFDSPKVRKSEDSITLSLT